MTVERRARQRDRFLAALAEAPVLMGILDVTPGYFSDGGRRCETNAAVERAKAMAAEGAAIIDVGGESTGPGHTPVSTEEELNRVVPVLEALRHDLDSPVSISTSDAAVAREAARLGASLVNDVWGLQGDPEMADTVAEAGSALVVTHNRAAVDASIDILDEMERFFARSLAMAARAGVAWSRILLDPGVGSGKTPEQDYACIWNLDRFRRFGRPILVGLARKPFIARQDPNQRLIATLAADVIGLARGASVLRVRDVREHKAALDVFNRLSAAEAPSPLAESRVDTRASVLLSLGGNVGDSAWTLRRAFKALGGEPEIELVAASRLYRTPPWGKTDQPAFVNAGALARTNLAPEALLERVKRLEVDLGRTPAERWGPRVIDIDIIAYDDAVLSTGRLTVPHPELFNRAFVLLPLAEIAPNRTIGGVRVGDAAARFDPEAEGIIPLD